MHREIDRVSKLLAKMGPDSELLFYYAGHGFPDEKTKIPYLIPVDVNSNNLQYIFFPDVEEVTIFDGLDV